MAKIIQARQRSSTRFNVVADSLERKWQSRAVATFLKLTAARLRRGSMRNLILLLLPVVALAQAANASDCRQDPNDAFDPAATFAKGIFKGQCLDSSTRRAPVIESVDPGFIEAANFYDQGHFYHARIPRNSVSDVLFQIVPFDSGMPGVTAAHAQLRFKFSNPIQLRPQSSSGGESGAISDVILSAAYMSPLGVGYNALQSRKRSYNIVTRFMSSRARAVEEILADKSEVRQYRLSLSVSQQNQLLESALLQAAADGFSKNYNLLERNCSTVAFDAIDSVIPRNAGVRPFRGSWWNIRDEVIGPTLSALKARSLISNSSQINPMNDEFYCYPEQKRCFENAK